MAELDDEDQSGDFLFELGSALSFEDVVSLLMSFALAECSRRAAAQNDSNTEDDTSQEIELDSEHFMTHVPILLEEISTETNLAIQALFSEEDDASEKQEFIFNKI